MNSIFRTASAGLLLLVAAPACFCQAAEVRQQDFDSHIRKANSYLREQRPDLALPELQTAVAIDPANVEAEANLGVLLFFKGEFALAVPHLRSALQHQPDLVKIRGLLGIAEKRTLDFSGARQDLEEALSQTSDPKLEVQIGLELLDLYTQSGNLDKAADLLAKLRKADPENAEVLYASYRTYSDLAGESMLALSLVAPGSAQMHQLLAHEETKEGNTNGAIAEYREAIQIDPQLPGVHFELAALLNTSENEAARKEARQEYEKALIDNPDDEKAACGLGGMDFSHGNYAHAFQEYSKAVALQPGDADAVLGLAKTLLAMDQLDKAMPALEEAERLEPTNALVHYYLATSYRRHGRIADAKREVDLYKKYKQMKKDLGAEYKDLRIIPQEIRAAELDTK